MKHAELDGRSILHFEQVLEVRKQGQTEYATAKNPLANFEEIAEDLKMTREQVLWVYAYKHIQGIGAYIGGYESQREDVTGRLKDAINYLFILWAMIEEGREQEENLRKERQEEIDALPF